MAGRYRDRLSAALRSIKDQGRRVWAPVATVPECTIGFADGPTGIAHLVTADTFAADRRRLADRRVINGESD
jgi:hypothetical protein